jgi:hypothetical protein
MSASQLRGYAQPDRHGQAVAMVQTSAACLNPEPHRPRSLAGATELDLGRCGWHKIVAQSARSKTDTWHASILK